MAPRDSKPKTTKKKTAKTPAAGVVIPPWPGISDDALQGLAEKLNKAKDTYRVSDMILKVNGDDWSRRYVLAWHLTACKAILPEVNVYLFEFISEQPDAPSPEVAVDLLVRLSTSPAAWFKNTTRILDGYSLSMDRFLLATYRRAPDLVLAREAELAKGLRLGLSFIRRRLGESIPDVDGRTILKQLAKHQASSYGITLNNEIPLMENGKLVEHRLADLPALRKLALLFGTSEQWDAAFLAEALVGDWSYARNVKDAFLSASAAELGKLVNRSSINSGDALSVLIEVLPAREDDPRLLIEAAKAVTEESRCREMLVMGSIRCAGKAGLPISEDVDELLSGELLDTTYEGVREKCAEWFSFFPRDRALALAKKLLQEDYQYSRGVGILAVHFDEQLLHFALEKDLGKNYVGHETLGGLGAKGLPQLAWAYENANKDGRRRIHRAILLAMAKAGQTETIDSSWERFIDFDREGDEAIAYYGSSDAKMRQGALVGIPEPRKTALLVKCAQESQQPVRILQLAHVAASSREIVDIAIRRMVEYRSLNGLGSGDITGQVGKEIVDALCQHIGLSQGDGRFLETLRSILPHQDYERVMTALQSAGIKKETARDALMRMCANAPGPKCRVYALHVENEGYEPKEGTLSRSGGIAPGLDEAHYPKGDDGEPYSYLFTLDLQEIPELQSRYPGARAIAAFCPDPNSGDRTDEFTFAPISPDQVEAFSNAEAARVGSDDDDEDDDEGRAIAVVALDVPLGIFERAGDDPVAKEIRKMIFNAAGHVLGEPFWIQDDEGGADFIMQINERLADMNLGDCGSLYVFGWGNVFQCY